MSRRDFTDYLPAVPFTYEVFDAMKRVAKQAGGELFLSTEGMVVVSGDALIYRAVAAASTFSDKDFPAGYVIAGTDSHIVFEF